MYSENNLNSDFTIMINIDCIMCVATDGSIQSVYAGGSVCICFFIFAAVHLIPLCAQQTCYLS